MLSLPTPTPIARLDWIGERLTCLDLAGGVSVFDYFSKRFIDVPNGTTGVTDFAMTADGGALLMRDERNLTTIVQTDSREALVKMVRTSLVGPRILLSSTPPEVIETDNQKKRAHHLARPEIIRPISFVSLGMPRRGRAHYSPDGQWLLFTSKNELRIVDHAAGTVLLTMPLEDAFCAYFSHDCKHLIVCEGRRISLHELFVEDRQLHERHIRDLKQVTERFSSCPSLSYNRRWLSVPETPERMLVLDCEDFETWQSLPATGAANVTWASGDGRWLVAGSRNRAGLRVWDRKTDGVARILREGNSSPKFSPDDRWLVEKDLDNAHITIYDTADWKPVFKTRPVDEEWPGSLEWSPDGRLLAISMASTKVRLIEAGTWRTLANLDGATRDVGQALFSPCGGYLLESSEALIEIWDLAAMSRKLADVGLPTEFPPPVPVPSPSKGFSDPLLPVERPPWFTDSADK